MSFARHAMRELAELRERARIACEDTKLLVRSQQLLREHIFLGRRRGLEIKEELSPLIRRCRASNPET